MYVSNKLCSTAVSKQAVAGPLAPASKVWPLRNGDGTRRETRFSQPSLSACLQVARIRAQPSWVTALSWASCKASEASPSAGGSGQDSQLLLAAGCCDGSICLLSVAVSAVSHAEGRSPAASTAVQHCGVLRPPDLLGVHCLDAAWLHGAAGENRITPILTALLCHCISNGWCHSLHEQLQPPRMC